MVRMQIFSSPFIPGEQQASVKKGAPAQKGTACYATKNDHRVSRAEAGGNPTIRRPL